MVAPINKALEELEDHIKFSTLTCEIGKEFGFDVSDYKNSIDGLIYLKEHNWEGIAYFILAVTKADWVKCKNDVWETDKGLYAATFDELIAKVVENHEMERKKNKSWILAIGAKGYYDLAERSDDILKKAEYLMKAKKLAAESRIADLKG